MVKVLRKSLILSCVLALLLPSVASADMNVTRIAGANRYETAMKVQQKYFAKANGNLAVLASGTDFKTALYGSYMANALKVPFYVIPNAGMSRVMLNELKRTGINRVYILGDYNKLNKSINNSLKSINISPTRITDTFDKEYGFPEDISFHVDQKIYNTYFYGLPRGGTEHLALINIDKFPDVISSVPFLSSLAKTDGIMMSDYRNFPMSPDSVELVCGFVIGGQNSVPIAYKAVDYDENFEPYSTRIAGQNRYKTAIEIAKAYKPRSEERRVG